MIFSQVIKAINEMQQKPVGIKVNSEWLEKELQQTFTLRKSDDNPLESVTGLKVITDGTVNTFEFIYD